MLKKICSISVTLLGLALSSVPAQAAVYKIVADSAGYIDNSNPNYCSNGDEKLRAENAWEHTKTYLRFHTGWIKGNITDAKLTLRTSYWGRPDVGHSFNIHGLNNASTADDPKGWYESTLTATTAPANITGQNGFNTGLAPSLGVMVSAAGIGDRSGTPVSFQSSNLVNFLKADTNKYVTFLINAADGQDGNSCFYSRWAANGLVPVLEITTDAGTNFDMTSGLVVNLSARTRQSFEGFGSGHGGDQGPGQNFGALTDTRKTEVAKLLHTDAKLQILRIWTILPQIAPSPTQRDYSAFERGYIESGLLTYAKNAGVKTLLLAPDKIPGYMLTTTGTPETDGSLALRDDQVNAYGELVAEIIQHLKTAYGLDIGMTGIANECINIKIAQWPLIVKALRTSLDARGLTSVKITGVEWSNNDDYAFWRIGSIQADSQAWAGLNAISTHSYEMPLVENFYEQFCRSSGKGFWMTESEAAGSTPIAAAQDLGAHLINDLNNGASAWIYHESALNTDPNNNSVLFGYEPWAPDASWLSIPPKYYYMKMASTVLRPGAVIRKAFSSSENNMNYVWKGSKINVTGGKNTDGAWGFLLINNTPVGTGQSFTIKLTCEDLAAVANHALRPTRSGPNGLMIAEQLINMKHGVATVTLGPNEMLAIRSSIQPPTATTTTTTASSQTS